MTKERVMMYVEDWPWMALVLYNNLNNTLLFVCRDLNWVHKIMDYVSESVLFHCEFTSLNEISCDSTEGCRATGPGPLIYFSIGVIILEFRFNWLLATFGVFFRRPDFFFFPHGFFLLSLLLDLLFKLVLQWVLMFCKAVITFMIFATTKVSIVLQAGWFMSFHIIFVCP